MDVDYRNCYMAIPLVYEFCNNNRTAVSTLRKNNKRVNPPPSMTIRDIPAPSNIFGFSDHKIMLSYVPKKKKKVVLVLTFLHEDEFIDGKLGSEAKPGAVMFYNVNVSGVAQSTKKTFSVAQITRRWLFRDFDY